MALFIFQFGLLQPLAAVVNSQWPIAGFTLLLMFVMLINHSFKFKKYVIVVFVVISIFFLLSTVMFAKSYLIIVGIYAEFILKCFSAFIIASLYMDGKYMYSAFLRVAVLNFLVLLPLPLLGLISSEEYMRYGYALIPSVLMFVIAALKESSKRVLWIILAIASFVLTNIYGSRGPLIVFILFGALLFIFYFRMSNIKKTLTILFVTLPIWLMIKYNLAIKMLDFLYFNMGIQTYALAKFRMMINIGLVESSSGRDILYASIWSLIKQNPYFGYGVGYSQVALGYTPHNIILQVLLETGIFGLIFWIAMGCFGISIYRKIKADRQSELFMIFTLIFSLAFGRLLISSDMWLRPEFWFSISMLMNYKGIRRSLEMGKGI